MARGGGGGGHSGGSFGGGHSGGSVQVVSVEDFQAVQATIHHITEVQEVRITDDQHHLHHRDRDIMADRQEECTMVPVVHHHADVCLVSLYLR